MVKLEDEERQPKPKPESALVVEKKPAEKSKEGVPAWIWMTGVIVVGYFLVNGLGGGNDAVADDSNAVVNAGDDDLVLNEPTEEPSMETLPPPERTDEPTGPPPNIYLDMVYIPEGSFKMGSSETGNEQPIHTVYLNAYWIDKYEVTNEMFAMFIEETGYQTDAEKFGSSWVNIDDSWDQVEGADWKHPHGPDTSLTGLGAHPVVQVSWNDADAYCSWAGKRLPTEAEWESATRGDGWHTYPWGNEINSSLTNYGNNVGGTTPIGSYPDGASPFGALDMSGNAWEWVSDWYYDDYYSSSPTNNPQGPSSGDYRVHRGGSWNSDSRFVRSATRNWGNPDLSHNSIGFRCVASP